MPGVEGNASVGRLLDGSTLEPDARAVLLLRICQLAQLVVPTDTARHWDALRGLTRDLPKSYAEEAVHLRAACEPAPPGRIGDFARSVVTDIDSASALARQEPDAARRQLHQCEQRLVERWWPFGKRPAWAALVRAWSSLDRLESIRLIRRLPWKTRSVQLVAFNRQLPLTREEWNKAESAVGANTVIEAACTLLDDDQPGLRPTPSLISMVSKNLLAAMEANAAIDAERDKYREKRERALTRYLKLAAYAEVASPGVAAPMEALLIHVATKATFDNWPARFTALGRVVNIWSEFPGQRAAAQAVLETRLPAHLRDFALAQWYSMWATDDEDARTLWASLLTLCADPALCEAWFLVTLQRRGLGETALRLARQSTRSTDLIARLCRAWLLADPAKATTVFSPQDIAAELVGEFLACATVTARVAWLRQRSRNGTGDIPPQLWSRPEFRSMIGHAEGSKHLLSLFQKDEPPETQFASYVRMHGCAHYNYEDVDPILLEALVAWDEEHGHEIQALVPRMWFAMQPDTLLLRMDVLRNAIFERCRSVLAAKPAAFVDGFVSWVKRETVDKAVTEQVGDTIYTFRLTDTVPFIFCLIAAQNVAKVSVARADALICAALHEYSASPDLVTSAARLYAAGRGLAAIEPPVSLKDPAHRSAWQIGVVLASTGDILNHLTEGLPNPVSAPGEPA